MDRSGHCGSPLTFVLCRSVASMMIEYASTYAASALANSSSLKGEQVQDDQILSGVWCTIKVHVNQTTKQFCSRILLTFYTKHYKNLHTSSVEKGQRTSYKNINFLLAILQYRVCANLNCEQQNSLRVQRSSNKTTTHARTSPDKLTSCLSHSSVQQISPSSDQSSGTLPEGESRRGTDAGRGRTPCRRSPACPHTHTSHQYKTCKKEDIDMQMIGTTSNSRLYSQQAQCIVPPNGLQRPSQPPPDQTLYNPFR